MWWNLPLGRSFLFSLSLISLNTMHLKKRQYIGTCLHYAFLQFPVGSNSHSHNDIFHRTRTNNFTICIETQNTSNSQSNLEKEEWNWRNQPTWLQALLQSHSHQESMVLAQRQKYRSMEQNRKPRDKSMHIWTPYLWQRRQEYTMDYSSIFKRCIAPFYSFSFHYHSTYFLNKQVT